MPGRSGPWSFLYVRASLVVALALLSTFSAPLLGAYAATPSGPASSRASTIDADASAPVEPTVELLTDASYYGANDRFTLTLSVDNPGTEAIREARIGLRIRPPRYSAETRTIFDRTLTYRAFLPPGRTTFTFSRRASSVGRIGAFPMTASLRSRDKIIARDENILSVLPEEARPKAMDVALVWGLHLPAAFDKDGVYKSAEIEENSLRLARNVVDPLLTSPGMLLTVAPTPLALYQSAELAVGRGESVLATSKPLSPMPTAAPPSSGDAVAGSSDISVASPAATALGLLRMGVGLGSVEILDSTLGNASLAEQGERRWTSDISRQLDRGRSVIDAVLPGLPAPRGFLAPGGAFAPESLRALAERGVPYVVVSDAALPRRERPSLSPFVHQDPEADSLTVLASASFASRALSDIKDQSDAQYAYGKIVEAYLWDRRRHGSSDHEAEYEPKSSPFIVLHAQAAPDMNRSGIQRLYRSIVATPWMRPSKLKDALARFASDPEILPQDASGRTGPLKKNRERYMEQVEKARFDLKAMIQADPEMGRGAERLWRLIYMAQDVSLASNGVDSAPVPADSSLTESWLREVHSVVDRRLKGVEMDLRPVTLSGNEGKIPVEVRNDTAGELRLSLQGLGKGVTFPDGAETSFVSAPGSQVIVIPVRLDSAGVHRIRVTLRAGDKALALRFAEISTFSFLPVVFATLLAVAVFLVIMKVRRRKDGAASP